MTSLLRAPHPAIGVRAILVLAFASALLAVRSATGQLPTTSATLPAFRPPVLALVQPASNASVPQDRPVIVFRFALGDSTDPVDAQSFRVSVDGKDRSRLFQIARDMSWGPLAATEDWASLFIGRHSVRARICSIRGACAEVSDSVSVAAATAPTETPPGNRTRTLIDVLFAALRKLLAP